MSGIMFRFGKDQKFSHDQRGGLNAFLIPFILATLFFIGAGIFGYLAFMSRQDYKNHSDQKVAVAVEAAKQQQSKTDAASYAQAAKYPLRTYIGPSAYGSINVKYPKTWSAYVAVAVQSGDGTQLDGYFQPATVPNIQDPASNFELRVQINQNPYDQVLSSFTSQVQEKQVTVTPYHLPKVPSVIGVRVDGAIEQNKQGSMIVLPLRATTLEIWTENANDEADFNNIILPNFSFSP